MPLALENRDTFLERVREFPPRSGETLALTISEYGGPLMGVIPLGMHEVEKHFAKTVMHSNDVIGLWQLGDSEPEGDATADSIIFAAVRSNEFVAVFLLSPNGAILEESNTETGLLPTHSLWVGSTNLGSVTAHDWSPVEL